MGGNNGCNQSRGFFFFPFCVGTVGLSALVVFVSRVLCV